MKLHRIILPLLLMPATVLADEPQKITLDWLDNSSEMVKSTYFSDPEKFAPFSHILCDYIQQYIKTHGLQESVYIEGKDDKTGKTLIPRLNFIDDIHCGLDGYVPQYRHTVLNKWIRAGDDGLVLFGLSVLAAKEIRDLRNRLQDKFNNTALNEWATIICRLSSNPLQRIAKCGGMDDGRCLIMDELKSFEPRYMIGCCMIPTANFQFSEQDDGWQQQLMYQGGNGEIRYRSVVNGDIESATVTLDMFDENCQPIQSPEPEKPQPTSDQNPQPQKTPKWPWRRNKATETNTYAAAPTKTAPGGGDNNTMAQQNPAISTPGPENIPVYNRDTGETEYMAHPPLVPERVE